MAVQHSPRRANLKYSCGKCTEADTEEMVQCDNRKCNQWFHYSCVNVDNSVSRRKWKCDKCIAVPSVSVILTNSTDPAVEESSIVKIVTDDSKSNKSKLSKSHTSHSKHSRRALAIQRLNEERALREERDKEYLAKKYAIFEHYSAEEEEEDREFASVNSAEKVASWLLDSQKSQNHNVNDPNNVNTNSNNNINIPKQLQTKDKLLISFNQDQLGDQDANNLRLAYQQRLNFTNTSNPTQVKHSDESSAIQPSVPQTDMHYPTVAKALLAQQEMLPLAAVSNSKALNSIQRNLNIDKLLTSNQMLSCTKVQFQQYIPTYSSQTERLSATFHDNDNECNANVKKLGTKPKLFQKSSYNFDPTSSEFPQFSKSHQHNDSKFKSPCSNSYNIFNHKESAHSYETNNVLHSEIPLNANHIAARHVISKELPNFTGRYEEWPLFISSFESTTCTCNFSNDENLIRLQRSLKGSALEAVRCKLLLPTNVPDIISTLRMLFGRPELIITSLMQKIRKEPSPRADKLETIIQFSLLVQNLCATMEASNMTAYLWNPSLIQELTDKLPAQIKLNWALYKKPLQNVTVAFSSWLADIAGAASDVTFLADLNQHSDTRSKNQQRQNKASVNTHIQESKNNLTKESTEFATSAINTHSCLICKKKCPSVKDCKMFINLTHQEKWTAVHEHKLCRKCLQKHGKLGCKFPKNVCGKNNCTFKHHILLHNDKNDDKKERDDKVTTQEQICNAHHEGRSNVLFRIIPVIVSHRNNSVKTFAFLDDGSSITLLEKSLADELELIGKREPLCLKWTGNTHKTENESNCVSFAICGEVNQLRKYEINDAHTVNELDLPIQSLTRELFTFKFQHLKNVPIAFYNNAKPRILIGLDNLKLQLPLKVQEGKNKDEELVAVKTRLGWTVYGSNNNDISSGSVQNCNHHSYHVCECNPDYELTRMMKEYYASENFDQMKKGKILESTEVERARMILETTTAKKGNHYEVGLLWKFDDFEMPDSLPMAKRRVESLEKKLSKDPKLASNLNNQIQQYVEKGYARKSTDAEISNQETRIWYLPVFPVTNRNKPDKIRLVWDAAAKANGVSLNNLLLKGPDETVSLLGVLFRFRERKVALCADISEMFHQVNIIEKDQQCQRFLWPNANTGEPDTYIMQVMTFGATCSPSSAQYIMKRNAKDFNDVFPRAVSSITTNHYVDDMLDCCDTDEEAIQLAKEVSAIHQAGGFHIRNWISNSSAVIRELGEHNLPIKKNLNISTELQTEKILGMWWNTSADAFRYSLNINEPYLSGLRRPTKREVLKTMMSIFDPLGLIAFYIVYIKIFMQDIWLSGIDWDDQVSESENESWNMWLQLMPNVENITIPRCYLVDISSYDDTEIELHTFADASERAYAAVSYIRILRRDNVQCSIIAAKSRVAPLKPISVPRLELEAAVLATRLAKNIRESLSIKIGRQHFWIDSKVVKCWINSDHRKYRQFVAFRISEMLESTESADWHWIPSKLNVADEATKWQKLPNFESSNRWFKGPEFLYQLQNNVPSEPEAETTEELKPRYLYHMKISTVTELINVEKFSNWNSLRRCVAYIYRYIGNLRANLKKSIRTTGPINQSELIKADNLLYRISQVAAYPDEVALFYKHKGNATAQSQVLDKSSSLYKDCPYLDEVDILRASGRINAAVGISDHMKNPILLARDNHITQLIVNHFHLRYHHCNNETVVNE